MSPDAAFEIRTLSEELARSKMEDLLATEREAALEGAAYSDETWGMREFLHPISRKWDVSVCALGAHGLLGFFIASAADPSVCHHHRAAVRSTARGHGVFRAMADGLMSRARSIGIRRFSAFAAAGHPATERLYLALGFSPLRDEELTRFLEHTGRPMTVDGDVAVSSAGYRKRLWYLKDQALPSDSDGRT